MRHLITGLGFLGLIVLLIGGNIAQIIERFPLIGYVFVFGIGLVILLHGLNGWLENMLRPWNGLNLKQVVRMYGWSAFFRGSE